MKKIWEWLTNIIFVVLKFIYHILGKDLSEETFNVFMEFVRFAIVGVSNTIVNYVVYLVSLLFLQKNCNLPIGEYYVAQVIAFILSVLWSYYWNSLVVFKLEDGEQRSWWKSLIKTYISYSFTGLFLYLALLYLWIDLLHISEFIAPIINLMVSVPINFLINKFWAFRKGKVDKNE